MPIMIYQQYSTATDGPTMVSARQRSADFFVRCEIVDTDATYYSNNLMSQITRYDDRL